MRADEHSSPASSVVENSDVRPPKVEESEVSIDIYISIQEKERVSSLRLKLANNNENTKSYNKTDKSDERKPLNPKIAMSKRKITKMVSSQDTNRC